MSGDGYLIKNFATLRHCSISNSYPLEARYDVVNRQNHSVSVTYDSCRCYSSITHDDGLAWTGMNYDELASRIRSKDIQLFDVRSEEEVIETGMIPGATNIPLSDVAKAFNLDGDEFQDTYGVSKPKMEDNNIVFNCLGGVRSRAAMCIAHESGFVRARHFVGGWKEWDEKLNS